MPLIFTGSGTTVLVTGGLIRNRTSAKSSASDPCVSSATVAGTGDWVLGDHVTGITGNSAGDPSAYHFYTTVFSASGNSVCSDHQNPLVLIITSNRYTVIWKMILQDGSTSAASKARSRATLKRTYTLATADRDTSSSKQFFPVWDYKFYCKKS